MRLLQSSKLDDEDSGYCNHSENRDEGTNSRDILEIKLAGFRELWDVADKKEIKVQATGVPAWKTR